MLAAFLSGAIIGVVAVIIAFAILYVVPWPITALVVVGMVTTNLCKIMIRKVKS